MDSVAAGCVVDRAGAGRCHRGTMLARPSPSDHWGHGRMVGGRIGQRRRHPGRRVLEGHPRGVPRAFRAGRACKRGAALPRRVRRTMAVPMVRTIFNSVIPWGAHPENHPRSTRHAHTWGMTSPTCDSGHWCGRLRTAKLHQTRRRYSRVANESPSISLLNSSRHPGSVSQPVHASAERDGTARPGCTGSDASGASAAASRTRVLATS